MDELTVRVTHAVPYIRKALCREAHKWQAMKKSRQPAKSAAARERAQGILEALRILALALDVPPVPGIADRETLPAGAVRAAAMLCANDFREVLGLDDEDPLDETRRDYE